MKIQNNKKTKITTIIASLVIGLIISSPMTVLPNVNGIPQSDITVRDVVKHLPSLSVSPNDETKAMQIAMNHQGIQKILQGKHYKFMASDWTGEISSTSFTAYPQIHINLDNTTQLGVVVDLQNNRVLQFGEYPMLKNSSPKTSNADPPSFAIDYYTGTKTINDIQMLTTAVSYTATTAMDKWLPFLVNAAEFGSHGSCTSSQWVNNYFAQAGILYNSTSAYTDWSDTIGSCAAIAQTRVPYVSGHNYDFEVFVSGSSWVMYGEDLSTTPVKYYLHSVQGVAHNTFQTSDTSTSLFLENWNTSTHTSWYSNLGANPSATANVSTDGGSTYVQWDNDAKIDQDCSGTNHPDTVITGNLKNGGTDTWDKKIMAQTYYGC